MREGPKEKKIQRKKQGKKKEAQILLSKRKPNREITQCTDITGRMTPALFKDTS